MRTGITTGSCAALAVRAAADALLTQVRAARVSIETPGGISLAAAVEWIDALAGEVCCGVRKDAGDDPDVTHGVLVCARVRKTEAGILLEGGAGIGRVTKEGLSVSVGQAAINPVPRRMIEQEAAQACARAGYLGGLAVEISIPGGAELAEKTFNPRLGVVGGLSVLGTSGIVEPMSTRALLATIALETQVRAAGGARVLVLYPGNYGRAFLQRYPWAKDAAQVRCSNFIGEAVDLAEQAGFEGLLLVGHAGKLVKLAGGIMDTHSRMADCRVELICAHAACAGASAALCRAVMEAATCAAALELLEQAGLMQPVVDRLLERISYHLQHRAGAFMRAGAVLFDDSHGLLGLAGDAKQLLERLRTERAYR